MFTPPVAKFGTVCSAASFRGRKAGLNEAKLFACLKCRVKLLSIAGRVYITSPLLLSVVIGVISLFPLRTWTVSQTCLSGVGTVYCWCVLSERSPSSYKDDLSCLSPCLFMSHETSLTGFLAEIPVSPITLTKCLSAIHVFHENSCFVWTVEVFGLHASAACKMDCVLLLTFVSMSSRDIYMSAITWKVAQSFKENKNTSDPVKTKEDSMRNRSKGWRSR